MNKRIVTLVLFVAVLISGCMPYTGGNFIARDNLFDSDGGIHSLEAQPGVSVKQLHAAILKAVKSNPKEFELKADDYGEEKSTVWTFSKKYQQPVTFYAMKRDGNVYLGIDVGENGEAKQDIKDIYYLEDLVMQNINE